MGVDVASVSALPVFLSVLLGKKKITYLFPSAFLENSSLLSLCLVVSDFNVDTIPVPLLRP